MREDIVSFVETIPTRCPWVHNDTFSFQPKRGWVLLQKACFWFLKRIGCFHFSEFTTIRRVDVDRAASMHEIMRQQVSLAQSLGRGGELLLIGAADWEEMLCQRALDYNPMRFDGEYIVPRIRDGGGPPSYDRKTMRVCVIPWMRGMVLVPREALEERELYI